MYTRLRGESINESISHRLWVYLYWLSLVSRHILGNLSSVTNIQVVWMDWFLSSFLWSWLAFLYIYKTAVSNCFPYWKWPYCGFFYSKPSLASYAIVILSCIKTLTVPMFSYFESNAFVLLVNIFYTLSGNRILPLY